MLEDDVDGFASVLCRATCGPTLLKRGNPELLLFSHLVVVLNRLVFLERTRGLPQGRQDRERGPGVFFRPC